MEKSNWRSLKRAGFPWVAVLVAGIWLLAGCGGGGSGDDHPPGPVLTSGVFIDSPVSGLSYSTPTRSGLTDADGTFEYLSGETVTFAAGQIVLGSTPGKAVVAPVDLVGGVESSANMAAVNISRFLQLVDVDGAHANGIELTEGIRALLTWDDSDRANDGSIFEDEDSIFLNTGDFASFMSQILTALDAGNVFTASTPRTLASRTATGARRNLGATLAAEMPHPFRPYVKEVGICVTDLAVSMPFYDQIMGMRFANWRGRSDRVEAVYEDNRPAAPNKVALMQYNDVDVNCSDHPVKLVFAVPDADTLYADIVDNGGRGFSPPAVQPGLGKVGMALDPDGYLIELIEATALPAPYLSAVGIGVSSLEPIDDFYTRVLGMRFNYYLRVPLFMNEVIMQSPRSPSTTASFGMDIVLMDYVTPRAYTNVPAKIVFTVDDPAAVSDAIAGEGLTIVQAPSAGVRGVAKDPNGYEVEWVEE